MAKFKKEDFLQLLQEIIADKSNNLTLEKRQRLLELHDFMTGSENLKKILEWGALALKIIYGLKDIL
jgi:hypothetical protein